MFVCVRTEYVLACALYSIPFNFICNITAFKKNVLFFCPHGGVEGVYNDRIYSCMAVLYVPFS